MRFVTLVFSVLVFCSAGAADAVVLYDSDAHGGLEAADWLAVGAVTFHDGVATFAPVPGDDRDGHLVIVGAADWADWTATVRVRFDGVPVVGRRMVGVAGGRASALLQQGTLGTTATLVLLDDTGDPLPPVCANQLDLGGDVWFVRFGPAAGGGLTAKAWPEGGSEPADSCVLPGAFTVGELHVGLGVDEGSVSLLSVRVEGAAGTVPAVGRAWSAVKAQYR